MAPRALVIRPLVKGNEDYGNEIGIPADEFDRMTFPALVHAISVLIRPVTKLQLSLPAEGSPTWFRGI